MITSSLPPELKVLIASGFLLGGGLFAQRYPAEREEDPDAALPAVIQLSETPSSPTTLLEQTSTAPGIEEGSRFETIRDFVNPPESREWSRTSMPEPDTTRSAAGTFAVAETTERDREHYGGMTIPRSILESAAEQEIAQRPEYVPFQTAPVTMPEPNPAFFVERPSSPNLTGLSLSAGESESSTAVIPGAVVAPSVVLQSGVSACRIMPTATATSLSTITARPVTPEPHATAADLRASNSGSPVVAPPREPRGNVIIAPARTTILPNPVQSNPILPNPVMTGH